MSAIEGGGATLEEASQRAESYLVDLETRGRELSRVRAEKEELERKVGGGGRGDKNNFTTSFCTRGSPGISGCLPTKYGCLTTSEVSYLGLHIGCRVLGVQP